jgi:dynein heavy chain
MQITEPEPDELKRLYSLIDNITKTLYTNVTRGLFEKDKLIFSFLIVTSINKNSKVLSESMWSIFLRGAGVFNKT